MHCILRAKEQADSAADHERAAGLMGLAEQLRGMLGDPE
jgi:hypothetical protein